MPPNQASARRAARALLSLPLLCLLAAPAAAQSSCPGGGGPNLPKCPHDQVLNPVSGQCESAPIS